MTHLFPAADQLGLLTDLYELTMAAGYHVHGLADQVATFELWVRKLPERRNYLVCAGVEQAVHFLDRLCFSGEQIEYLRAHPAFSHVPGSWFEWLGTIQFQGDVWALPEGTVAFAGEPLLRITGPLAIAQIAETYLITTMTMQTMVATKAARTVVAAQGRSVVDFGSRRAHGPQAGLLAARASYLAGCAGTSNTEAARVLNVPAVGTQAHAWIMAFDSEVEAFRKFGEVFPQSCTLLIDTYDTLQGLEHALASGAPMQAVRLDSGDLLALSQAVRKRLNEAGRGEVKIVASGDLNEYKVRDLVAAGAPIDVFGVGTELVTSKDEPSLNTVYKLVEQQTPTGLVGRFKLSTGKKTYPFAKQVFRTSTADGTFVEDVVALGTEQLPGEPLLVQVMQGGQPQIGPLDLETARRRCAEQLRRLPERLRELGPTEPYAVRISPRLEATLPIGGVGQAFGAFGLPPSAGE